MCLKREREGGGGGGREREREREREVGAEGKRKRGTAWDCTPSTYRLVGLVVKVSASRADDLGFESRLRLDFFGVESYQ